MAEELPEVTRSIYIDPQNPSRWMSRAMNLWKLGFADLAAGDTYKAIQLLDSNIRDIFSSISRDSNTNFETLSELPVELATKVQGLTKLHGSVYQHFASILLDTDVPATAQAFIREARAMYPSDIDLAATDGQVTTKLKKKEKTKHLRYTTVNSKAVNSKAVGMDLTIGAVLHLAYPFIPQVFLSRSDELIRTTQKEIETEAKAFITSCSLRSSGVHDPTRSSSSGAPPPLGIFATRDCGEGEPLLFDTTAIAATVYHNDTSHGTEICDNCCGDIHPNSKDKCTASCCAVIYCSPKCRKLAWKEYHQVLCKQDFKWVWDASKEGDSTWDLNGPMWLRILAICVQSKVHPLEHPLIARLTPGYEELGHRVWSLANNIIMPNKILRQLGVNTYADPRFDTWVLQTLWARSVTNATSGNNVS